jgi:hypothetical protein
MVVANEPAIDSPASFVAGVNRAYRCASEQAASSRMDEPLELVTIVVEDAAA